MPEVQASRMTNRRAADAWYGTPGSRSVVHPHQFRHTTVDDLLSAGVSEAHGRQVLVAT